MGVNTATIIDGLRELGLTSSSDVVVHGSLRSFGQVDGGARSVIDGLSTVCRTMIMMAGSGDLTGLPAPPGLVRPDNAYYTAEDWESFDRQVAEATAYRRDLPVDRWLGVLAETLRTTAGAVRGPHPLISFAALGDRADELIAAESLVRPLGALEALVDSDGEVVLLGVDHSSNTTIHVAEQRLGRGLFHRYGRLADGLWAELPNVSGESHHFDLIEPALRPYAREVMIGDCRARRFRARDVIAVTTELIDSDPDALLCDADGCRCAAARAQIRRAQIRRAQVRRA